MYILIGEHEGDYDDHYQRYRDPVAVSESKEALERYRDGLTDHEYIDFDIEKVPVVKPDFSALPLHEMGVFDPAWKAREMLRQLDDKDPLEPDDLILDGRPNAAPAVESLGKEYPPSELLWVVGDKVMDELLKRPSFDEVDSVLGFKKGGFWGTLAGISVYNDSCVDPLTGTGPRFHIEADEAYLFHDAEPSLSNSTEFRLLFYGVLAPGAVYNGITVKTQDGTDFRATATAKDHGGIGLAPPREIAWKAHEMLRTAARVGLPLDGADAKALEAALTSVEQRISDMKRAGTEIGKVESWEPSGKDYPKCVELGEGLAATLSEPEHVGEIPLRVDKPPPRAKFTVQIDPEAEMQRDLVAQVSEQIREGLKGHIGYELDKAGKDRLKEQVDVILGKWDAQGLIRDIRIEKDPTEAGKYNVTYTVPNITKLACSLQEETNMDINRSRPPKDGDVALWLSGVINDALRDAIEAGLSPRDAFHLTFHLARTHLPGFDMQLSARAAARMGFPLDGADAQALESALAAMERRSTTA